jgi:cytochrome c553
MPSMKLVQIVLAAAVASACGTVLASGNAEAGHKKSTPCQACHGPNGISVSPAFPNLAGQNPDYIVTALRHYKEGKRKNPIMQGQAANLSERDIEDLAAYFSSQKGLDYKY